MGRQVCYNQHNIQPTCQHVGEHAADNVMNFKIHDANFAVHCDSCACRVVFESATILGIHKNWSARELYEAFCIQALRDSCVGNASVLLTKK